MNDGQISIETIRACQYGSEPAFDRLYDAFGDVIWRLCYRIAHNSTDAEDLAQEAWITIWSKIGSFRCDSSFSTWIYRVTTNVCLQWKRQRTVNSVSIDENDGAYRASQPERTAVARDEAARLHDAVKRLPDTLRIPLELRIYEDLSYDQIAGILGCTPSAVRMRVSRARAVLTNAVEGVDE